jgi:hypothetical protein
MRSVQRKIGPLTLDIPAAIVGVQILTKGMAKLESLDHHPFIVTSLLLLGGFVFVAAFLPLWLEKRIQHAHALFHLAEGVAMSLSAVILFEKGKLRIPIILAFVGLMYVAVGFLESRSQARRERLAGPMLRGTGCVFLVGGVVLAGFTAFRDQDVWAYSASGLFVVLGAALLLGAPHLLRRVTASAHSAERASADSAH